MGVHCRRCVWCHHWYLLLLCEASVLLLWHSHVHWLPLLVLCCAPKLLLLLWGYVPLLGRLGRALADASDGTGIHSAMRVGWIASHCVFGMCLTLVSVQWGTAAAAGVMRAGIMPVGPAVRFTFVDAAVVWPAALIV